MANFKRRKPIKKWLRGGCSCGWCEGTIKHKEFVKKHLVGWEFDDLEEDLY